MRFFLGMTFIPYTLMNAAYVVIGSMLSPTSVHWDRLAGLVIVYLLAVGISAHALDALGANKPWGSFLTRRQLKVLAVSALAPALALGLYYALGFAPWLLLVGLTEVFFLLSYNLEMFGGKFHTENWFAFSWGFLPVVAGYVLQTNSFSPLTIAGGLFGYATAYVEINGSKPYKALKKRASGPDSADHEQRFERVMKGIVVSVLTAAITLVVYRMR